MIPVVPCPRHRGAHAVSHISISDARWDAILRDFRNSPLTQAEFCQRRGLSLHTFRNRLYRKPKPAPECSDTPAVSQFFPVTVLPAPITPSNAHHQPLELILSNGRRIAVAPGFDPQTLRHLIAAVEQHPCSD